MYHANPMVLEHNTAPNPVYHRLSPACLPSSEAPIHTVGRPTPQDHCELETLQKYYINQSDTSQSI